MAAPKPVVLQLLRSIVGIPGILCAQRRSPGGALGDAGVADFNRCTATGVDDPPTPQREEQGGETSGPFNTSIQTRYGYRTTPFNDQSRPG